MLDVSDTTKKHAMTIYIKVILRNSDRIISACISNSSLNNTTILVSRVFTIDLPLLRYLIEVLKNKNRVPY